MRYYSKEKIDRLAKGRKVDELISAMQDRRTSIRSYAALSLANMKTAKVARAVAELLKDPSREVVITACEVLGRLGKAESIPALIKMLSSESIGLRNSAANALSRMGDKAVIQLSVAMIDSRPYIRALIATILGNLGVHRAVKTLVASLEDTDKGVRRAAIVALGRIGDANCAEILTNMLGEFPEETCWSLARLGKKGLPYLLSAAKDRRKRVRSAVCKALGRVKDRGAVEPLIEILQKDESPIVRKVAAWALGEIGDERAILPLLRSLPYIHEAATQALSKVNDKKVVVHLRKYLKHRDEYFRSLAVWTLGELGNPQAIRDLAIALDDESPEVRSKAAVALVRIGTPEAIEVLLVKDTAETRRAFREEEVLGEGFPEISSEKSKAWFANK
jgi:HEAT repeat protein